MSPGSTVLSEILDRIYSARTGRPPGRMLAYEKTREILRSYGLPYDPGWDSTEALGVTGGSTITNRGYSRMLAAETGVQRCYVISAADIHASPEGGRFARYEGQGRGKQAFSDGGTGSLVLISEGGQAGAPEGRYIGVALVGNFEGTRRGAWGAELLQPRWFAAPISFDSVQIIGANPRDLITEVTWDLYREIVGVGSGVPPLPHEVEARLDGNLADGISEETQALQVGMVEVAGGVIPSARAAGVLEPSAQFEPSYSLDDDSPVRDGTSLRGRSPDQRLRDKEVERRAVLLVNQYLQGKGWTFRRDRQPDGVGYDLEMSDGSSVRHVEVKGIAGSRLEFNLTPFEWWRACEDHDFLVAAVTDTLDPQKAYVHLLEGRDLMAAQRSAVQYRLIL